MLDAKDEQDLWWPSNTKNTSGKARRFSIPDEDSGAYTRFTFTEQRYRVSNACKRLGKKLTQFTPYRLATICRADVMYKGKVLKLGIAEEIALTHPTDVHDFLHGAKVALRRCIEKLNVDHIIAWEGFRRRFGV